jgi:Tyrosine-protein kinase ephrin type A/B receptor-like
MACTAGTYADHKTNICVPCPANTYAKARVDLCTPCPLNMYSLLGDAKCRKCAKGYKLNAERTGCQLVNPIGTRSPTCPPTPSPTSEKPILIIVDCAPSFYRRVTYVDFREYQDCVKCAAGTYTSSSSDFCYTCPAGSMVNAGQTGCLSIPPPTLPPTSPPSLSSCPSSLTSGKTSSSQRCRAVIGK